MRSETQPCGSSIPRDLSILFLAIWVFAGWAGLASRGLAQGSEAEQAAQLLAEADALRLRPDAASKRAAIEKYAASLPIWRRLGDRKGEGQARHWICSIRNGFGEREAALGICEEALALRREAKDRKGEAETLNIIANIQQALRGPRQALPIFEQSLAIRRELQDRRGIAVTLGNLARVQASLGEAGKRVEALQEAISHAQAIADSPLELSLLNLLAGARLQQGEFALAEELYSQALTRSREAKLRDQEAAALSNLGALLYERGEKERPLRILTEALALHRALGARGAEAATLTALSGLWRTMGEAPRALRAAEEAVRVSREAKAADYLVYALLAAGDAHRELADYSRALALHREAEALSRQRGVKKEEALAVARIAIDLHRLKDFPAALDVRARAISMQREMGDRLELMYSLLELCSLRISMKNPEEAAAACREARELSLALKDRESQANAVAALGQIAMRRGELAQAQQSFEEAMALVESIGAEVTGQEARASYQGFNQGPYLDLIELLMQRHRAEPAAGHDRQALQVAERARARSLLAMLAEARLWGGRSGQLAHAAREAGLLKRLEAKAAEQRALSASSAEKGRLASVVREIDELTAELELVRGESRRGKDRLPQPLALAELQASVIADADTALLEYVLDEERSYVWVVTRDSLMSRELPGRETIDAVARRAYEAMTARNRAPKFETPEERRARLVGADAAFDEAAAELSRLVLAPIADGLNRKRLLIVADGALQRVPFAVLPAPGRKRAAGRGALRLIESHEIVHLPSAATLAALRHEIGDRRPASGMLAVLADPVFDAGDPRVSAGGRPAIGETRRPDDFDVPAVRASLARLRYSRQEAEAIAALASAGEVRLALDFDATRSLAVSGELARYRYLHFATHGLLNDQHPALSGLALSQVDREGRELEGNLRLAEIQELRLPAEMIVLSACNTGLGKDIRGEGLLGLTQGFLRAGAARVLVSLWDVNDRATAALMMSVYRGVLRQGRTPAASLRAAQLEMMKSPQWRAPYFWAPFVLMGEPK